MIAVVAIAATGASRAWRHSKQASPAPRIMMAVLPFEDFTGDPQKEYFADGLTEGMISQLGRLQPERLGVIARTSVAQYRHTKKSVKEIGHELGVEYVLECSVQRVESHMRIDAQLIQTSDQTQIWSETYEREIKDVLELQSNVARSIAGQVRLKLSPEQTAGLSRARSLNPDAYDAFLRGRYFQQKMTPDAIRQAAAYYQQAIELDPNYAVAYAGLAQMTVVQQMNGSARPDEVGPREKSLALRALELDDQLAEAHAELAFNLLSHEWDWAGAQLQFRRALELDPNNADIRRRYAAEFLSSIGRHTDAIAELKSVVEYAPLFFPAHTMLGRTYYHARRYDEAIAELTRTTALDASPLPHLWLGLAHAAKGKYNEALGELKKTGDMIVECVAARGYVLARAGDRPEAEKVLDQLIVRSSTGYVPPDYVAKIYAGLGNRDDAFARLEKAYVEHSFWLIFLRVDPAWDSIRDDARFVDLVRRVGIPSAAADRP
jgi:TolB-like protein/Tfp pilus assembly protein PilF